MRLPKDTAVGHGGMPFASQACLTAKRVDHTGPRLLEENGMRVRSIVALLLTLSSIATNAFAVTVPGDYPTIQAAIDAVPSGTTINVQPGTYAERLLINSTAKSITIRG